MSSATHGGAPYYYVPAPSKWPMVGAISMFFFMVGMAGMVEADMGLVNNRWKPDGDLANVMNEVTAGAAMRGVMNACAEPFGPPVLVNRG